MFLKTSEFQQKTKYTYTEILMAALWIRVQPLYRCAVGLQWWQNDVIIYLK